MVSVTVGVALVVTAYLIHTFGVGPDWLAWRLAMIAALAGLYGLLAPVASTIRHWIRSVLGQGADLIQGVVHTNAYREAIVTWIPRLLCAVAALVWIGAMITAKASRWLGRVATISPSGMIAWGAGVAMVLFGASTGGHVGDVIGWLAGRSASGGGAAFTWLFGSRGAA